MYIHYLVLIHLLLTHTVYYSKYCIRILHTIRNQKKVVQQGFYGFVYVFTHTHNPTNIL